ncbi:MAG TPA: GNAT family N-acetyltransferase [Bryobacteraceae bacterium]|nr:GNAT family N-acetyltransferase [Bryobacteraceae bacterium]
MQILAAEAREQIEEVRRLFEEYWNAFGFTPCFQNFGEEVADLPGAYAPPRGRLGLAVIDGSIAGCIALRPVDTRRGEMKRLYVRPEFRRHRIGHALVEWIIAEARAAGYRELVCDTMPAMKTALAMYEQRGFERTDPYSDPPTPGAIYLRLKL